MVSGATRLVGILPGIALGIRTPGRRKTTMAA